MSEWSDVFQDICSSLVRISATYSGGTIIGTGTVIAKYKNPNEQHAYAVATAEHVFKPLAPHETIHWRVEQLDWRGNEVKWNTFKSNLEALGNSPIRAHLKFDIGILFPPLAVFSLSVAKVTDPNWALALGQRVGWAGFPSFVSAAVGKPLPCYFEGTISAVYDTVETDGRLFYLVDGHGGRGVSGGPLWAWDEDAETYFVVGICSQYIFGDPPNAPGMVNFEAINPLISYLQTSEDLELNIAEIG